MRGMRLWMWSETEEKKGDLYDLDGRYDCSRFLYG